MNKIKKIPCIFNNGLLLIRCFEIFLIFLMVLVGSVYIDQPRKNVSTIQSLLLHTACKDIPFMFQELPSKSQFKIICRLCWVEITVEFEMISEDFLCSLLDFYDY